MLAEMPPKIRSCVKASSRGPPNGSLNGVLASTMMRCVRFNGTEPPDRKTGRRRRTDGYVREEAVWRCWWGEQLEPEAEDQQQGARAGEVSNYRAECV